MKEIIFGTCPSKSNCYRIARGFMYKSKELQQYEKSFALQCRQYRNKNIEDNFEFNIDVYYPNNRSDLDNSLKVVLDCLQKCNAIKNDNKCVKITATKFIDKEKPRIEFSINQIN